MQVAQLVAVRKLQLTEWERTEPGTREVEVRVRAVGICGSDLHNYLEGGIGDQACRYPMVLGHEATGEVVRCGPGVDRWKAGDRVALEPAVYCYRCEYCLAGRHNVCANIRFYSMADAPGLFRQYAVLPVENLLPLPAELSFETGTLFEPLAVVLHSMKFVSLQPEETVAVFGAGPIGLLTVMVLKSCGAGRIWAIEPVAHRRQMALTAGADVALHPGEDDVVGKVLADTRGRGVDVVVDCATRDGSTNLGLRILRNAGRLVITGIPREIQLGLEFHVARRKEITIFNVRRSCRESDAALEMLRKSPARFEWLVTHVLPLSEVEKAFRMLEAYSDGAGKVVLRP